MEHCGDMPVWSGQRVERTNVRGPHSYCAPFKSWIVEQALQPGRSLAGLAMRNQVNANQLRRWVKLHRQGAGEPPDERRGRSARSCLLPMRHTSIARCVQLAHWGIERRPRPSRRTRSAKRRIPATEDVRDLVAGWIARPPGELHLNAQANANRSPCGLPHRQGWRSSASCPTGPADGSRSTRSSGHTPCKAGAGARTVRIARFDPTQPVGDQP